MYSLTQLETLVIVNLLQLQSEQHPVLDFPQLMITEDFMFVIPKVHLVATSHVRDKKKQAEEERKLKEMLKVMKWDIENSKPQAVKEMESEEHQPSLTQNTLTEISKQS
ncbi:hypothetical protein Clacol_009997 [Clathrus columnatus]|uniref:Uncharacterized protein n=1 Tax=Clathrus columnatus TaxID=1419009 RepID=A0AAV5AM93_9AGAM|nr:hypothetical protein Clacol_009997 [Clathrus columnatus]